MAATRYYGFTALTGGGTGALDKYPEAGGPALQTGDTAFGIVNGVLYVYCFNATSVDAESVPERIAPSSGSGMWELTVSASREHLYYDLYYGVTWDEIADTYVRTGSTAGQTCGVTLADAFLPVHRRMRGCLVADDGTVNYYLCATDWTKKEDGATASNLDGTDGQVMVEIPKFYYRYGYSGTSHTWEVSPVPLTGFKVHEMFMSDAHATGIITSDGTIPSDADTVTIGSKTYTFKTVLTPTEGEVLIGGSAAVALDNLKSAIMHTGTPDTDYKCAAAHPEVLATDNTNTTQTVVSILPGTVGNTYGLAVSDANMSVSAAYMAGGSTTEKDYVYVGAYEACLYDKSAAKYVGQCYQTSVSAVFDTSDDSITIATRTGWATNLAVGQKLVITGCAGGAFNANPLTVTVKTVKAANAITVDEALVDETATVVIQTQTDVMDTTGDKLCSVSGVLPITGGSVNGTRAHFRTWAENRGGGKAANDAASAQWSQMYADAHSGLQLLYLTEYASFYSQSVLGYGIAAVADWGTYNDYNPIAKTGNGNAIGNASGNTATAAITTGAGATSVYLRYRGIENWYGHLWKFVDGYKVNNNIPYLCNNFANFSDAEATTNYTNPTDVNGAAITMHNASGYQGTLELTGRAFMPASITGGAADKKITDYYYQDSGWRVVYSGGDAYNAADDGAFYLSANYVLAIVLRNIGGRLMLRK